MTDSAKRIDILPAKRRAMILEHLRAHGAATIQDLAMVVGGSQSTIRRDLEHLTDAGYLERTHGGALLIPPMRATFEGEVALNAELMRDEKRAIGAVAAQRISPRDTVILDSSSTVLEAARVLAQTPMPLTVVTNSLAIASLAATVPDWRVVVPGGTIHGGAMMTGEPGEMFLGSIHADILLIGSYSVSGSELTDASLEIASLKRQMMRAARRRIVLVDSSKFRPPAFRVFATLGEFEELITDTGIPADARARLSSAELKVTIADPGGSE